MQSFVDRLLRMIRSIGPHRWVRLIRRRRRVEGSMPPMLLIGTVGVWFFSGLAFSMLGGSVALTILAYVALAPWFILGLVLSLAVSVDGVNNLRRFGVSAIRRPRWWFELSRLTWMLLLFALLSMPLLYYAGGPLLRPIAEFLFRALPTLFIAFMVLGTAGYLVSGMRGRRRRGRAFECVQWFYWMSGILVALVEVVEWLPANAGWAQPMTLIACVIALSLMGILCLTIADRWKRRITRSRRIAT